MFKLSKFLFLIFFFSLIFLVGWIQLGRELTFSSIEDRQIVQVQLGEQMMNIEVVREPSSITQGLSQRSELGSDGMLFILPSPQTPVFWMKDMQFDLDLIWLKENRIVEITSNVPKPLPSQKIQELAHYQPQTDVDMVLEIPAGKSSVLHFKPGDKLTLLCTSTPRKWYDVSRFYDCPN